MDNQTMNRITPEMLLEAYKKTGLKPRRRSFYWREENSDGVWEVICACGIGVLNAANGGPRFTSDADKYGEVKFGFQYYTGFMRGFDGCGRLDCHNNAEHELGYEDGRAAWEAVKHLIVGADGHAPQT